MTDYRDGLEIDLFDLLKFTFKKWKILLIAAVVGAMLGGVYATAAPSDEETVIIEDINTLSSKLTDKERSDADLAYRAYMQCMDLYDQLGELQEDDQTELRIELVKATQQILAVSTYFTVDQKKYYASLFGNIEVGEVIDNNKSAQHKLAKYIIVGAFVGLFLAVLICTIKYILIPVLKTEDDLRSAFHLPVIGTIDSSNINSQAMIVSGITACARNWQAGKLCLISSIDDAVATDIRNKVGSMLDGKEMLVRSKGNVMADPNAIDDIVSSDGVILFEKVGQSRYDNIARVIELCRNSGVPIIGAAVIHI